MSASDKKKLRKEQEAVNLTDKQLQQQKEDKQLKINTWIFVGVMILVVAIVLGSAAMNWYNASGIPARNTTALTVGKYELSNADLNYYFIDSVNAFYNEQYETYTTYTAMAVQMTYGLDMTSQGDSCGAGPRMLIPVCDQIALCKLAPYLTWLFTPLPSPTVINSVTAMAVCFLFE